MEPQPTQGNPSVTGPESNKPVLPGSPKRPSWVWIAVFIVVLAVIGGVVFAALKHLVPGAKKMTVSKTLPKGYNAAITGQGSFPPGFPTQLVFDASAKPFHGETTTTGSGEQQKIAEYYSSSTPDFIYNIYKSGLALAGWKPAVDISSQTSKVLVFSKPDNQSFQVLVTPYKQGAQVKLVAINIK